MKTRIILHAALGLFAIVLQTHAQIFHPSSETEPYFNFNPESVAFIDLDMDGRTEILSWNDTFDDEYYINQNLSGFYSSSTIGFGDFNEDGFEDMVFNDLDLSLSDNTKTFGDSDFYGFPTSVSSTSGLGEAKYVTIADFNNDDHLDVLAYQLDQTFSIYRFYYYAGDGTGALSDPINLGIPPGGLSIFFLASTDFTGDNLPDLIFNTFQGTTGGTYICQGMGDGSFDLDNPVFFNEVRGETLIGDVNNDNQDDLVIDYTSTYLVLNQGSSAPSILDLEFNVGAEYNLIDLNGDGNLDIINDSGLTFESYLGDGAGMFQLSDQGLINPYLSSIHNVNPIQYNDDEIPDFLYEYNSDYYLSLSDQGTGRINGMMEVVKFDEQLYQKSKLADLNGDSFDDYITIFSDSVMVRLNDGAGKLLDPEFYITSGNPKALEIIDIDEDNDADILVGCNSSDNVNLQVFTNNGNGGLNSPVNFVASAIEGLDVGDIDRDGDLDVVGVGSPHVQYFLNDGSGGLNNAVTVSGPSGAKDVELLDFNDDDNLDLVIATGAFVYGLAGDGAGSFDYSNSNRLAGGRSARSGDFNNDGVDDFVTYVRTSPGGLLVYFGAEQSEYLDLQSSSTALVGNDDNYYEVTDLNADGHLDVLKAERGTKVDIALNDGTGNFSLYEVPLQGSNSGSIAPIAIGDLNNDNKTDAVALVGFNSLDIAHLLYNEFELSTQPAFQASSLIFSGITSDSTTISWTKGEGNGSLVIVSEEPFGEALPQDGEVSMINAVSAYPFESATSIGEAFVVYDGEDSQVILSSLPVNSEFYVAVYSYNGSEVDRNYLEDSPASSTFTTLKGTQEVTINEVDEREFQYEPFLPDFTINSGLETTLSILGGPAEINSDGKILINGLGEVVYAIDQAGNEDWNALVTASDTIQIIKGNQTISFNLSASIFIQENDLQLPIYTTNDLPIDYSIDAGSGSLRMSGDTTFYEWDGETQLTITASQSGNDLVNAAVPVSRSTSVVKQDQVINWGSSEFTNTNGSSVSRPLDGETLQFRNDTLILNASSNSGLPVTYVITEGPGFLEGTNDLSRNYIYNRDGEGTGQVTISASAAGNEIYNSTIPSDIKFTITKGSQTISFEQIATADYREGLKYKLEASSESGLPIVFEQISGSGISSISNDSISTTSR